jgi:hypothetical protein
MTVIKKYSLFIIFLIITNLFSQQVNVNLSGTVRDQNKQPLSGVQVRLSALNLSTTTDANGKYSITTSSITIGLNGKLTAKATPILDNGLLKFRIESPKEKVHIAIYDLLGKNVATIVNSELLKGDYNINPYVSNLNSQVYFIKVKIGNDNYIITMPVTSKKNLNANSILRRDFSKQELLAKIAAAADTLKLVKTGYSYEKKGIGSYIGVHDFIMVDTAWFWGDRSKIPKATKVLTYVFLNRTNGKFTDAQMFWKFGNQASGNFADNAYYDMPANSSGRVYVYAGSSNSQYNDFMEHTISATAWYGNTTRVDAFVLPIAIRLHCKDGYDEMLGEEYHVFFMGRDSLWKAYKEAVPVEFDTCARYASDGTPLRIIAPGKGEGVFNTGQKYANYYTAYLQQIGYPNATTNQVFSCSGTPFGSNTALAGATNRHVAHLPQAQWKDVSLYYKEAPANFYAKFWHDHSFQGKAYGFAYDDAEGQEAYTAHNGPEYLIIAVGF